MCTGQEILDNLIKPVNEDSMLAHVIKFLWVLDSVNDQFELPWPGAPAPLGARPFLVRSISSHTIRRRKRA